MLQTHHHDEGRCQHTTSRGRILPIYYHTSKETRRQSTLPFRVCSSLQMSMLLYVVGIRNIYTPKYCSTPHRSVQISLNSILVPGRYSRSIGILNMGNGLFGLDQKRDAIRSYMTVLRLQPTTDRMPPHFAHIDERTLALMQDLVQVRGVIWVQCCFKDSMTLSMRLLRWLVYVTLCNT